MNVIDNFSLISDRERYQFASDIVERINAEGTFSSDIKFSLAGVESDEFSGGLVIILSTADLVEVPREASWTCDSEEDAGNDPGYDADYYNHIFDDVKKVFKTMSTKLDEYTVSLEVVDATEEDVISIEVHETTQEDSGIGDYDYWGASGYDSSPYVSVEGVINQACVIDLDLRVELA